MLCLLLYALVGLVVTALPGVLWLWPLALAGVWLHILELTVLPVPPTPQAGWQRWLVSIARLGGAGALIIALAIALNQLGSDQLDQITLVGLGVQVLAFSLLAFLGGLFCRYSTATLAKGLQARLPRRGVQLTLALTTLTGLALGGTIGRLLA